MTVAGLEPDFRGMSPMCYQLHYPVERGAREYKPKSPKPKPSVSIRGKHGKEGPKKETYSRAIWYKLKIKLKILRVEIILFTIELSDYLPYSYGFVFIHYTCV